MTPLPEEEVRGTVVGPPLEDADVAELDELAREERDDELVEAGDLGGDEAFEVVESSPPRSFVQMRFVDVAVVLPATSPLLVLEEIDPPGRELQIPIGSAEGVAIAYAARGIATPRPLTHELVVAILEAFSLAIDSVRITGVDGAAFRGEIVCSGPTGTRRLACRPSDGVALALRQRLPAPILVAREVLDQVGRAPTTA